MTRTRPSEQEQFALREICPLCRAGVGTWCRTVKHNARSRDLHINRFQVATHRATERTRKAMDEL